MKPAWSSVQLWMLLLLLGCLGCGQTGAPEMGSSPLKSLTDKQLQQKMAGLSAKDLLFETLLKELMGAMSSKGPVGAISICQQRAPEIASEVKRDTGVKIGRTSFKLRNGKNQPPKWAADWVQQKVENEVVVELPEDHLGLLLPIRLKTTCTLCHGIGDQVMPEVRKEIAKAYPDDQATGFRVGEIRGYFWMEVPEQTTSETSQTDPANASGSSVKSPSSESENDDSPSDSNE